MRIAIGLLTGLTSLAVNAAEPVIEFYNAILNHYFMTIVPEEAAGIDNGAAGPGWHRTARVFGAYAQLDITLTTAAPVCRFYGNVANGGPNSHFYTVDAAECAAVKLDPGWTYEGIAFYVKVPVAGHCPDGTTPVRRNYNQRFVQHDSNHRYTTDLAVYQQMQAQNWKPEGVVFCTPAG